MKTLSPLASVTTAVAIHGLAYGTLLAVFGMGYLNPASAPRGEAEVGYEVLNEPPAPTPVAHRVVRAVEPERPADPQVQPDHSPHELQDDKGTVAGTQTAVPKAASAPGSESAGTASSTPYYKIKPKYPRAALVAGTEGWVLMKVDINEHGDVENVRVVDGQMRNLFQDEARRAVEKWKYRPFTDQAGKPFRKSDHQVRVDFKLNEASTS